MLFGILLKFRVPICYVYRLDNWHIKQLALLYEQITLFHQKNLLAGTGIQTFFVNMGQHRHILFIFHCKAFLQQ